MSKVTPSRPGAEPPSAGDPEQPINVIDSRLAQARAIVDLVATADREAIFDDTVSWALHAAINHIDAARKAADKLNREAHGH